MTESARAPEVEIVTPSRFVRRSVISFFIGLAITFLTTFGVPLGFRLRVLAYGGMGGFLINAWCHILARAFGGWLARHAPKGRLVFAVVYFVGGLLGLVTASVIAVATSLIPFSTIRSFFPVIALTSSAAAVVVGLVFYTFGLMENRLRESVERVKEGEFAQKELELAREIQQCLLPPPEVEGDGWRVAIAGRRPEPLEKVAAEANAPGRTAPSESSSPTSREREWVRVSSWRRSRRCFR